MSAHGYRLLNAILVSAMFAASAWVYPRLPARIPVHFGLAGEPDRWADRSPASWFMLPVTAAGLALLLHGLSAYGARHPETWNLPDKPRFLALPPEEQAPIVARMQRLTAFIALCTTVLMGVLQAGAWTAASGGPQRLPAWTIAFTAAWLVFIVVVAVRENGPIGRMVREAHARAGG